MSLMTIMDFSTSITYWLLANYLFLKEFEPVQLKAREERVLDEKLRAIGVEHIQVEHGLMKVRLKE